MPVSSSSPPACSSPPRGLSRRRSPCARRSTRPRCDFRGDPRTCRRLLDATRVDPNSLRIVDDLAPLTSLSSGRTTRTTRGNAITVTLDRTFSCLSSSCVSPRGDAMPALPQVRVTVGALGGETLGMKATWPTLRVQGQVTKADLGRSHPPFRADTTPAPPSYRLAPSTLAWLLYGAAVVLALAGAALAVHEARALARRRRGEPTVDELERALRLAREAENRPPPDRPPRAGFARSLAGSTRPPSLGGGQRARLGGARTGPGGACDLCCRRRARGSVMRTIPLADAPALRQFGRRTFSMRLVLALLCIGAVVAFALIARHPHTRTIVPLPVARRHDPRARSLREHLLRHVLPHRGNAGGALPKWQPPRARRLLGPGVRGVPAWYACR